MTLSCDFWRGWDAIILSFNVQLTLTSMFLHLTAFLACSGGSTDFLSKHGLLLTLIMAVRNTNHFPKNIQLLAEFRFIEHLKLSFVFIFNDNLARPGERWQITR